MIKKLLATAVTILFVGGTQAKSLNYFDAASVRIQAAKVLHQAGLLSTEEAQGLNWGVGEYHAIDIELEGMGNIGTGEKSVTKDVPAQEAFWYVNDMNVMGQAQKSEALMRRSDGKVLKLIVNGEEQDPDQGGGEVEIIEQYQTTVTVPAGTFDCFYIKAKITDDSGKEQIAELWVNPADVNLDGMLKIRMETQFGGLLMILREFGKK
ncbi:DUF3108 domain-containing protein [bacterium]|nr:DUF3108 domain-containing protein [bacterium]